LQQVKKIQKVVLGRRYFWPKSNSAQPSNNAKYAQGKLVGKELHLRVNSNVLPDIRMLLTDVTEYPVTLTDVTF
jgi:hypothetical protein